MSRHEEFEVMLISSWDHKGDSASQMYANFAGKHVHLSNYLAQAREQVAALELDILCYLDIGMEPLSYFMAFSRLARAQCVLGGHPVTTGIGNMDYHLSSALTEPADADKHYNEKLVRLPIGLFYYERPVVPAVFRTRAELGLPESGHIYSCPMMLQKIHPDFDEAIARILQLDPNGYVVLFQDDTRTTWKGLLERRFMQTIPEEARKRIIFLPWLRNYYDFVSVNALSDVVLDPFNFGIGTTAIATFSVGTPIVTRPGEFLRGRVGLGYCKLLDVMECVAADTEEYAKKAVAIATEPGLRETIKSRILANNPVLFENPQPIQDVTDFFLRLGEVASNSERLKDGTCIEIS